MVRHSPIWIHSTRSHTCLVITLFVHPLPVNCMSLPSAYLLMVDDHSLLLLPQWTSKHQAVRICGIILMITDKQTIAMEYSPDSVTWADMTNWWTMWLDWHLKSTRMENHHEYKQQYGVLHIAVVLCALVDIFSVWLCFTRPSIIGQFFSHRLQWKEWLQLTRTAGHLLCYETHAYLQFCTMCTYWNWPWTAISFGHLLV